MRTHPVPRPCPPLPLVVAALAAAGGCAFGPQTAYVPVGVQRSPLTPVPVAPYALDGDQDKGTIEVLSLDGERLPVGWSLPELYLRLRLVAHNKGDGSAWRLDPNEQLLSYGGGMVAPAFAKTSAAHPVLSVAKGGRGWLDLYYPLPESHDPPEVTLWWRVRRGAAAFRHTTHFTRVRGRDLPREPDVIPLITNHHDPFLPSGLALGWWWPDYCFRGGGYYDRYRRGGPQRRYRLYGDAVATERAPPFDPATPPSYPSSSSPSFPADTAANWRNPSAGPDPAASQPGDAAKSGWRGGGR